MTGWLADWRHTSRIPLGFELENVLTSPMKWMPYWKFVIDTDLLSRDSAYFCCQLIYTHPYGVCKKVSRFSFGPLRPSLNGWLTHREAHVAHVELSCRNSDRTVVMDNMIIDLWNFDSFWRLFEYLPIHNWHWLKTSLPDNLSVTKSFKVNLSKTNQTCSDTLLPFLLLLRLSTGPEHRVQKFQGYFACFPGGAAIRGYCWTKYEKITRTLENTPPTAQLQAVVFYSSTKVRFK